MPNKFEKSLEIIKHFFIGQVPNSYGQYIALVPCSFEDYEELVDYIYENLTINGKKVEVVCGFKQPGNITLDITFILVD